MSDRLKGLLGVTTAFLSFGSLSSYSTYQLWDAWAKLDEWQTTIQLPATAVVSVLAIVCFFAMCHQIAEVLTSPAAPTPHPPLIDNQPTFGGSMESSPNAMTNTPVRRVQARANTPMPFNLIAERNNYQSGRDSATSAFWILVVVSGLLAAMTFLNSPCLGIGVAVLLGGACWGIHAIIRARVLNRKTRLFCPACKQFLASDLEWVCARCGQRHSNDNKYSFLTECKNCGDSPSAYQCHYSDCGEIIYLTRDLNSDFCAYGVGKENPKMNRRRDREEELAEMQHSHDLVKLKLKSTRKGMELRGLEEEWERAHTPQPKRIEKSFTENIEAEWAKQHKNLHDLKSFVSTLKAAAQCTHAGDEEGLNEALADIEDFYERILRKQQGRT